MEFYRVRRVKNIEFSKFILCLAKRGDESLIYLNAAVANSLKMSGIVVESNADFLLILKSKRSGETGPRTSGKNSLYTILCHSATTYLRVS